MHILAFLLFALVVYCSVNADDPEGFREFSLYHHNYYRKLYGLTPLRLSGELNNVAHTYAETLANNHEFKSSNNGYGENLWVHRGTLRPLKIDCRDAINNWFAGSQVPGNVMSRVDYDALLSNYTTELGIGVGTAKDYTVVVANYL